VKDFAKLHMIGQASYLPHDVAAVVYYATLAVALLHGHDRMTRLTDDDLARGIAWAMAREWIEPEIAGILRKARDELEHRRAPSRAANDATLPEGVNDGGSR